MPERTRSMTLDEANLLQEVGRGREEAVEKLYRTYADDVFRFIYRRVEEQREDAEEITQDTFLSALNLAATFRGESSVYAWLCGIAKVRIIDFYRKRGRDKRIPADRMAALEDLENAFPAHARGPFPGSAEFDRVDSALLVDRLMLLLSEDEREALTMRYVDGLSVREISSILKRTEKGIENLLLRAKAKQRETLKRWWSEA